MKNLPQFALSLLAAGVFAHANASTITISTGFSDAGAQKSAAAYKTVVDAAVAKPTAGYGSKTVASYNSVDNSSLFGSSTNIAFRSTIDFGVTAAQAGSWSFRTGVDFSNGGALFLDGVALDVGTGDMWWNGSYSNSAGFLSGSGVAAVVKKYEVEYKRPARYPDSVCVSPSSRSAHISRFPLRSLAKGGGRMS